MIPTLYKLQQEELTTGQKESLQWHPAFCCAMRLELRDEKGLEYIDEYSLTDKPLQIDLMIIKKLQNITIKNKIGKIFKDHNIIEYKSPDDKLNINTFYKSMAYTCLYKDIQNNLNDEEKTPAEPVVQIVSLANKDKINTWREEYNICQALKEIMRPDFEEGIKESFNDGFIDGFKQGEIQSRIKTYYECGVTPGI